MMSAKNSQGITFQNRTMTVSATNVFPICSAWDFCGMEVVGKWTAGGLNSRPSLNSSAGLALHPTGQHFTLGEQAGFPLRQPHHVFEDV